MPNIITRDGKDIEFIQWIKFNFLIFSHLGSSIPTLGGGWVTLKYFRIEKLSHLAPIGWLALSSLVRCLFSRMLTSPLKSTVDCMRFTVQDHTNHILFVRIWSWEHCHHHLSAVFLLNGHSGAEVLSNLVSVFNIGSTRYGSMPLATWIYFGKMKQCSMGVSVISVGTFSSTWRLRNHNCGKPLDFII